MSDKIFRYKVIVEAVDKPLRDMKEQLKSITDTFKKQRDELRKTTDAINTLASTYKKFEVGKLGVSNPFKGIQIFLEAVREGNKKRQEELVVEKKKEVEDRFDKVLNNSYGETYYTLNFDISNVKKENAAVKESRAKRPFQYQKNKR
jgi:soluble cytochrome b562